MQRSEPQILRLVNAPRTSHLPLYLGQLRLQPLALPPRVHHSHQRPVRHAHSRTPFAFEYPALA